jgi:ABC-type transport system involved in multi-copper enzyme maturation permease subunit
MIWLTWRQFRAQAITAAAVLGAFAIALVATGPALASRYAASGVAGCHGGACASVAFQFLLRLGNARIYPVIYAAGILLTLLAPAIIGMFWGAPLIAHELEAGTHRLAWNQSVTRNRWLTAKLALIGLAAMAFT